MTIRGITRQNDAANVLLVQALADADNGASFRVIEACRGKLGPPLQYGLAFCLTFSHRYVMRVVNYQNVTADTEQCAADTGCETRAALGIIDLDFRILIITEGKTRSPKPLIERRLNQSSC